jgi:hypothetical protein
MGWGLPKIVCQWCSSSELGMRRIAVITEEPHLTLATWKHNLLTPRGLIHRGLAKGALTRAAPEAC